MELSMKFTVEDTLNRLASEYKRQRAWTIAAKKKVDKIRFNPWLLYHKQAKGHVYVWEDWEQMRFVINNVDVGEFIECVLGPIHREEGLDWVLELGGSEDDPVFTFKDKGFRSKYCFQVKEGDFKSCKVTRVTRPLPPLERKKTEYYLECE